ncbi:hypothetical protein [Ferruginibacter profundus]
MQKILLLIFCLLAQQMFAQDSCFLKVHFLYGSKPLKAWRATEQKWFGGILGGHVGIEGDSNRIVNFLPSGKFHWFAKNNNRHSHYAIHSQNDFYGILGGNPDSVKRTIVYIPVSRQQKQSFDSIAAVYIKQTPYDYALAGMRCGAAAYEILAQLNILPAYSYSKTYRKILYPKKLRKRLFKKARANGWTMLQYNGSSTRKWEKD